LCKKVGNEGTMIRGNPPTWQRQHVGRVSLPFPRHSAAEQQVIHPAVSVVLVVVVSPGDAAPRGATKACWPFAVALRRASVDQRVFSTADDRPYRPGILEIVEVAEHDQVQIRIGAQAEIDDSAQNHSLLF